MKIKTKIELSEKELSEILSEMYGLKNAKLDIYKYDGDMREGSYTQIIIEGEK